MQSKGIKMQNMNNIQIRIKVNGAKENKYNLRKFDIKFDLYKRCFSLGAPSLTPTGAPVNFVGN